MVDGIVHLLCLADVVSTVVQNEFMTESLVIACMGTPFPFLPVHPSCRLRDKSRNDGIKIALSVLAKIGFMGSETVDP